MRSRAPSSRTSTLDAAVMRAMAHPARLALLEHLRNSGPATATECAGVVGLSPSATSYHLRALARAGLVEAAPGRGDGRERLVAHQRRALRGQRDRGPGSPRDARRCARCWSPCWPGTTSGSAGTCPGSTPSPGSGRTQRSSWTRRSRSPRRELTALGQAVEALIAPYRKDRRGDLPPGTRPVSVAVRALPS